ncbi:ThuA domain-containing protein [Alkalicoccus daliensis]|uniref:Trehalose utilisation n=1 Tax=Alkalicoccus daliensis TaxID=745820 RepID=A0A1H0FUS1_9BACI|nr:ThuA domain-containing protein [Alkalicoccus daliensis]SDN98390.1 Trehalose utilisation [Alkalicoccus daliensis]
MVKIIALLGDYWHKAEDAEAGLENALTGFPENEEIDLQYVTHEEVAEALQTEPDLFINAKMDPLNPKDENVITWLTEELDQQVTQYVKNGGSMLAWHAGMAGYASESRYIQMLRGAFDYHPPGLQQVTYQYKEDNERKEFTITDEQYFVHCDTSRTYVDLWSTGPDGDAIAGWKHLYEKGRVCCFSPAHTKEGMLDENVASLLFAKISWLLHR